MREQLKKLLEQRASIWEGTMKPLVAQGSMSPEEAATYDAAEKDLDAVEADISRLERALIREAGEAKAAEGRAELLERTVEKTVVPADPKDDAEKYDDAFKRYLRVGMARLSDSQRSLLEKSYVDFSEARNLGTLTGAIGGYTVPVGFQNTLVDANLSFGGLRNAPITAFPTGEGNDIQIPTGDDTGNTGELLTENSATSTTSTNPVFGQVVLKAWQWSSKIVRVHRSLLQDSAFDLETWLANKLGQRIGRIQAGYLITGTGTNEPQGIVTGTTIGATSTLTATIGYDDFVNLEHSVDPVYRQNGQYVMSDNALAAARKIKDAEGRPLWVPSMVTTYPSTINGRPYFIDLNMASVASTNKPILFGDLSYYWVRDVAGAQLLRLEERFAEFNQVAFLAFTRMDARKVDASDDPFKVMVIL